MATSLVWALTQRAPLSVDKLMLALKCWSRPPAGCAASAGRVVQAVRKAGVRDPVLLLDEVDKMGRDARGDPAAALLEVSRAVRWCLGVMRRCPLTCKAIPMIPIACWGAWRSAVSAGVFVSWLWWASSCVAGSRVLMLTVGHREVGGCLATVGAGSLRWQGKHCQHTWLAQWCCCWW